MLFEPIKIKKLTSKNRIVMAPMCQYKADNGMANDYHLAHYVARAIGQVGTIIIEATAVEPRGRISGNDLGLWDDMFIAPLAKIVKECKKHGSLIGIQIAHAGRKSKVKGKPIIAPSPLAFSDDFPVPKELSGQEIVELTDKFAQAVNRAMQAGFDFVEIHAAHGYLINEFLSPLTNKRSDEYGENRVLFLKEILKKAKSVLPEEKPIFLRVSGNEYHHEGNSPEQLADLLMQVTDLYDVLHVSSGGVYAKESYEVFPAYQLNYAEKLKKILNKQSIAVGMLGKAEIAEQALATDKADLIAIGRGLLNDPHWALHTAAKLGVDLKWPGVYERAKSVLF